ncbi:MAG: hypothetical protein V7707_03975 [Motiliproteus sp.]
MIKTIAISAISALLLSATAHADKIKLGVATDMGFGVTAQLNDQINAMIGNDGASMDYIFRQGGFEGQNMPFTWYAAGGGFVGWDHGFGLRLPLGLDWNFAKRWDAFAQLSPEIDFDAKNGDSVDFDLGGALGVRYAF